MVALQPAHRGPGIEAGALELVGEDRLLGHERLDGVRQLDLATGPTLRLLELVEDLWRQHVAADDREVRGRGPEFRLLDESGDLTEALIVLVRAVGGADDAVARRVLGRDLADREHGAVGLLVGVDQLADGGPVADHDVVGQEHGEGLVADEVLGHEHRVTEAELFLLADVGDLGEVADVPDLAELLDLPLFLEEMLELVRQVEVVLDRPLLARGDDDDLLDAGRHGLFDRVLDDRLVDERQHFLWLRLGRREESGTPAGCREDCFSDAHDTPWAVGGQA